MRRRKPVPNPAKDLCAKCGDYFKNHPFEWRSSDGKKCLDFELGEECIDDPIDPSVIGPIWASPSKTVTSPK